MFNFHGLLSVLHAAAKSLRSVRSEPAPGWLSPLRPLSRDTSLFSPAIGEENSWKKRLPLDVILPPSHLTLGISPSVGTSTWPWAVKATHTWKHTHTPLVRGTGMMDQCWCVVTYKKCVFFISFSSWSKKINSSFILLNSKGLWFISFEYSDIHVVLWSVVINGQPQHVIWGFSFAHFVIFSYKCMVIISIICKWLNYRCIYKLGFPNFVLKSQNNKTPSSYQACPDCITD